MNRLGVSHQCDGQIDGRTDFPTANAPLNCVTRQKKTELQPNAINYKCPSIHTHIGDHENEHKRHIN